MKKSFVLLLTLCIMLSIIVLSGCRITVTIDPIELTNPPLTEPITCIHSWVEDKCSICDKLKPSEGLTFTLGSIDYYIVTSVGTCTDTNIVIPDTYNDLPVKGIDNWAFYGCDSLTSVVIPDGVTTIGDYAFKNCSGLNSVDIGNGLISIGDYAFQYCNSLTSVTIPDGVTIIGDYAFYDCDSMTSVTIPDTVTTIGACAFCSCDSLTNVIIPNSVTTIGNSAFDSCTSLTGIWVNENNPTYCSDEKGVLFNKEKTFLIQAPCKLSGTYIIPNSVTTIDNSAFYYCDSLTSVTIPDSVVTIGDYAFWNCSSLTSVTIPDSVTTIGESAFYSCASLTSITIPNSVTTIECDAFSYCNSLTSITYKGTIKQWQAIDISDYFDDGTDNYTIYCTDGKISKDGTVTYY